jgi:hypothetical protein
VSYDINWRERLPQKLTGRMGMLVSFDLIEVTLQRSTQVSYTCVCGLTLLLYEALSN